MLEILLIAATILGGLAALWYFYERFFTVPKNSQDKSSLVSKKEFNRAQSEEYKERGRECIQKWADAISKGVWNWDFLGQAFEYYFDAIKYDPKHQHPWTNLAFVYHLIGEKKIALECLEKSRDLASPGTNFPGRNYKQVERALKRDTTLSGHPLNRPIIPENFRRKYEVFLTKLPKQEQRGQP